MFHDIHKLLHIYTENGSLVHTYVYGSDWAFEQNMFVIYWEKTWAEGFLSFLKINHVITKQNQYYCTNNLALNVRLRTS